MMTRTLAVVVLLLGQVAIAAPAPLPKPDVPKEHESLYLSAEADLQSAVKLRERANHDLENLTPLEYFNLRRTSLRLARSAAEKFTRLDTSLATASRRQRDLIALKAGKAWAIAGDKAKAQVFFDRVGRPYAER